MLESTTLRSEGRVDFPMQDEDPDAMLIIMHIIHGRTHQVPRSVSLDLLTKIATSVDYLECLDLIEPFADGWINALKKGAAATYSKALIQWLCVSLIFRKENLFAALTRTAIRQAKGPIQTLGLPIRDSIVGEFLPLIPPKKKRLYSRKALRKNQPNSSPRTRAGVLESRRGLETLSENPRDLHHRTKLHVLWPSDGRARVLWFVVSSSADSVLGAVL